MAGNTIIMAPRVTRPIVRYYGGKWKLADWIISHFPHHRVYVEPFGGGGSVLLKKSRSYAEVYNDRDTEIVNLFRIVRDHGDELRSLIANTPYSRVEFDESYTPHDNPVEQARRTIVRSFMGYSSTSCSGVKTGFRANSNRSGTIPAHDWASYAHALNGIITRLQGVVIENRDACEVMKAHDSETTLHYIDPPYLRATRTTKSDSYKYELNDDEHVILSEIVKSLCGYVIVSGYASDLYNRLYSDFTRVSTHAYADGANYRVECLWLSPKCKRISLF